MGYMIQFRLPVIRFLIEEEFFIGDIILINLHPTGIITWGLLAENTVIGTYFSNKHHQVAIITMTWILLGGGGVQGQG